jgi:SAM-dependent methyltransferase
MSARVIPLQEINYHATSYCDRMGRVFWWQGELFRGIGQEYVRFYRQLFENGVVQGLVEKGFIVETELTDWALEEYPLVLKHRAIPFVSYASEWCPEMLREAGLFITDLMVELARHDLTLADASSFDLLFDGVNPFYVDFTTIVDADYDGNRSWKYFREDFLSYFIWPVRLAAQGHGELIRWLMAEYNHDVILDFISLVEGRDKKSGLGPLLEGFVSKVGEKIPRQWSKPAGMAGRLVAPLLAKRNFHSLYRGLDLVQQLRQEIEQIQLPASLPLDSSVEMEADASALATVSPQKQSVIQKVLTDLSPESVIDLGSGIGRYSHLAASLGSKVVAIDKDETIVSGCYQKAKKTNLPILPLVMNLSNPSPGLGACNRVLAPATQRLACDLVLALSLVEHLVVEDHLTFDQIAETFASFSKRWVLVEFASGLENGFEGKSLQEYPWYSFDSFWLALQKWFRSIQILPSSMGSPVLLLCEK